MRFKLTLLLLLANTAVFYFVWSLGRSDDASPAHFSAPPSPTVESIRIEGKGLEKPRVFTAERDGRWKLVSPIEWSANPHAVNGILSQLQLLSKEINFSVKKIEESGRSLADYGLDDPTMVLTVTAGGVPYVLKIGALTQIGDRVYLLAPSGDTVIVAPQELLRLLSLDIEQVRSNRIFTIPAFEVRGLSVRTGTDDLETPAAGVAGQRTGLVKTADGWRLETPVQTRADGRAVEAELALLTELEADRFVLASDAATPATYGLSTPTMRVSLEGNRRETLLVGRPVAQTKTPRYYAQIEGNPAVFTVAAAPLDALRKAHETLRDRHVLAFDPQRLTALELKGDGQSLRFQRLETGAWQVLSGNESARVDPQSVDAKTFVALLQALLDLNATAFVTDAPSAENLKTYGLANPVRALTLSLKDEKPLTLLLGRTADDAVYATVGGGNSVYQVHPSIIDTLSPSAAHYRTRTLAIFPETAKVERLSLVDLQTGKTLVEGTPDAVPATLTDAQKSAFAVLADSVKHFRVAAYEGAFDPAHFARDGKTMPWRYRLTAHIAVPTGAEKPKTETVVYDFTARDGGTAQYGGSAAAHTAFALTQPLTDALWAFTDAAPAMPPVR